MTNLVSSEAKKLSWNIEQKQYVIYIRFRYSISWASQLILSKLLPRQTSTQLSHTVKFWFKLIEFSVLLRASYLSHRCKMLFLFACPACETGPATRQTAGPWHTSSAASQPSAWLSELLPLSHDTHSTHWWDAPHSQSGGKRTGFMWLHTQYKLQSLLQQVV